MTAPVFDMKVRDLAEKIYVDLLRGAVEVSQTDVKMTADPKNIAKVSFKLAASFHQVQDELNAENLPKNQDFKMEISDIEAWSK
ncbi:MAG: hypothetical protein AB7P08_06735 [Burkholderiales bacterium]